jgi:oxygen-independent coproporphyrinogen-3 oxidase
MSQTTHPTSLYFHFPFCETKCHYCDFYSLGREKTKDDDATKFERAMIQEINLRGEAGAFAPAIDTIFLGGGTPSMTPPESMRRIFDTLFQYTRLAPDAEWTMEANPSSIELSQFEGYRSIGINRVSMGVQSLKDSHLEKLGRVHNQNEALRALDTVFTAGFKNVSTDLLCGVPGQTLSDLESHLRALTAFPITHLSIYLLTLPPHHKMYRELPHEDEQLAHLLFIDEWMRNAGFIHYEISNFCKPNHPARHNLVYWKNGSYLAFGPSAHGHDAAQKTRTKNVSSLHKYADLLLNEKKLPIEWCENLSEKDLELEKWLLAIRLDEGFPKEWIKSEAQHQKLKHLLSENLLEPHPKDPSRIRATPRGFALSDGILKTLV